MMSNVISSIVSSLGTTRTVVFTVTSVPTTNAASSVSLQCTHGLPAFSRLISSRQGQRSSLTVGADVGIAVGAVCAAVILGLLVALWRRLRKGRHVVGTQCSLGSTSVEVNHMLGLFRN